MTAEILETAGPRHNALDMARQNWQLARKNYREVCERFDGRFPESVAALRSAAERRSEAFSEYMKVLRQR